MSHWEEPLKKNKLTKQGGEGSTKCGASFTLTRLWKERKYFLLNWQLFMWSFLLTLFFYHLILHNKYILVFFFIEYWWSAFVNFYHILFYLWVCVCLCVSDENLWLFIVYHISYDMIFWFNIRDNGITSGELLESSTEDDGIYNELNDNWQFKSNPFD